MPDLTLNEVTFLIDSREQTPWDFTILNSEEISIKEKSTTLSTGDYSLQGYEDEIAIERKSLNDLLGCVTNSRERFEKELLRLKSYECRAVLIEAPWEVLEIGSWRSQVSPAAVTGSCIGWMQKGIPFFFAKSSKEATIWAARYMVMYHKRQMEKISKRIRKAKRSYVEDLQKKEDLEC